MKQYHLGNFIGAYYSELLNSLQIVSVGNAIVGLTVLWAVAPDKILSLFPWLTYPLFMVIVFFAVLGVLPIVHYTLLYKTTQAFLNRQGYAHDNPFKKDIDIIRADLEVIKKALNDRQIQ